MRRTRSQGRVSKDIIEEGREEANKSIMPSKSDRRSENNGGDVGGKKAKYKQERVRSVGSIDVDLNNIENTKEAREEVKRYNGSTRNCRETASPLPPSDSKFCNKIHWFPLKGSMWME